MKFEEKKRKKLEKEEENKNKKREREQKKSHEKKQKKPQKRRRGKNGSYVREDLTSDSDSDLENRTDISDVEKREKENRGNLKKIINTIDNKGCSRAAGGGIRVSDRIAGIHCVSNNKCNQ